MIRIDLKVIACAGWIAFSAMSASAPALAQSDEWNALYDRVIRIEHELKSLRGGAVGSAQQPTGDVAFRMTSLEDRMRQVLGQMQELSQQVRSLQISIRQLQAGRKSGALEPPLPPQEDPNETPLPEVTREQTLQEPDLSQYQPQDLAALGQGQDHDVTIDMQQQDDLPPQVQKAAPPKVLGTLSTNQTGTGNQTMTDAGESSLLPESVESSTLDGNQQVGTGQQVAAAESPDSLYEGSYDNLLGRRFGAAEAGFKLFLGRYGDHALAGDAQYWLGETYYAQKDYKQAAQSFLKGYRGYPKNRKAPQSLLKLAMSLQKLGQKPQACGTYAEVAKQYPTAAELRNQAIKEMQRAGC